LQEFSIPKVFFDSDALIAGSASRQGAAFLLLQLAELSLIQGFTSQKVLEECHKNLQIKLPDAIPTFNRIVQHALTVLDNPSKVQTSKYQQMAHEKDLPILTSAVTIKAQFLVTFNTKDFYPDPKLGLVVLEPGELLKSIRLKLSQMTDK